MRTIFFIGIVEIVAFIIGLLLWHFAAWPWWTCLLALLAPAVIVIVLGVLFFANASSNGSNPFQ
jgi:membrane protein implicated in regulation of membrane protease activity